MSSPNGNAVEAAYTSLHARLTKLAQSSQNAHPAVKENLLSKCQEVDREFIAQVEQRRDQIERHVNDAATKADSAEADAAAAEAELRQLEEDLDELLDKQSAALKDPSRGRDPMTSYLTEVADLHAQIRLSETVLQGLAACPVDRIRDEKVSSLDARFAAPNNWSEKAEEMQTSLNDVKGRGERELILPPSLSTETEAQNLARVVVLGEAVQAHLAEAQSQRETRDAALQTFYVECERLCAWCRQQLINLEAMDEPDHVQEYSATLVESYPTMSNNFSVLLESVSEYVKANNADVRRALLEAEELWFYLQVSTLERLAKTLYEVHPKSPLEVEVDKYAGYPEHFAEFCEDLRNFLQSAPVTSEATAILDECESWERTMETYSALSEHTRGFAHQARAVRAGYNCLREAVLGRLTYISPSVNVVMESKRRQDEFEDCVRELRSWASTVAHGESWRDLYSKIVEIKRMIKDEQASLDATA